LIVFKKLACYIVGLEPELPELELPQNLYSEPEPHATDTAQQHFTLIVSFFNAGGVKALRMTIILETIILLFFPKSNLTSRGCAL
jgi:hypothetical protein